ncbi:MAG TPA: hypothetical protein DCF33_16500, partial [Saprospirales bacterium]|nr:hypothetical protein [Saprospirales bacterium]
MKKLEFLVLFNLTIGTLCAQPSIQWQYCYGGSEYDEATSVQVCLNSDLVFAGVSQSTDGNVSGALGFDDFWIIRTKNSGQIIWSKCYGGSNHEKPYSIQQTLDRGFIVAGFTKSSDGDVTGQHGASDAWILKIDSTGQIQWQKCLGGEGHDLAWDICQTKDGGYVFAGQSGEIGGDVTGNNGYFDCWVVKLDSEGALVWQRSIGGGSYDIGYCIQETEDSGFILCGESQSNDGDVSVNFGNSDYWVVKLNFEGKIEWEQSYGGSALDRANEIQQTPDGGFLVFGQSRSVNGQVSGNHGGFDAWLLKVDSIGNLLWQNPLGGTSEDFGRAFIQKEDGNIWA